MRCHTSDLSTEETLLGQYVPLHYHYNLLQDQARMASFREAIGHVVRPGMSAASNAIRPWSVQRGTFSNSMAAQATSR